MVDVHNNGKDMSQHIPMFEGKITALFYCVSLDSYDCPSPTNPAVNALTEALENFKQILSSFPEESSTLSLVLYYTKEDLFEEKLKQVDLKVWDPNYKGTPVWALPDPPPPR